jgi:DNA (cytosine-5)-methyltransferase 1
MFRKPPSNSQTQMLPLVSLFCGAGGLDLGFERAGFQPLLALDADKAAVETYNWNRPRWPAPARIADLSEVRPETVLDWWEEKSGPGIAPVGAIGGPPCQAFSVSNVHRFENDCRARLPLNFARLLKAFNERHGLDFFVFENAAGLGHQWHRHSLQSFLHAFNEAGFKVQRFYLDAATFGVPQRRRRLFVIGFNRQKYPDINFTPPTGSERNMTVRAAISHLTEPLWYSRTCDPCALGLHPNHWCMNAKSARFKDGSLKPGEMRGRSFRVLRWDEPSWTVAYGHREVHVHPNAHRRLSVYEAMWLQGLAPLYELRGTLCDQVRLVSDAVPPPVAYALATQIADVLGCWATSTHEEEHQRESGHSGQLGLFGVHTSAPRSTRA